MAAAEAADDHRAPVPALVTVVPVRVPAVDAENSEIINRVDRFAPVSISIRLNFRIVYNRRI